MKILVATGGTGGHVFPAYALAKNLMKKNFIVKLTTDKRGYRFLTNNKNINVKIVNTETIFEKNLINTIISVLKIFTSFFSSLILLIKFRPKLVFGMGGYSSFPMCIAAKILRIPFVIYENNLFLGKTNRYLLPFSKKLLVAYGELQGVNKKYFKKIIRVGNIIREDILNYVKEDYNKVSLKQLRILVLGGSQAARSFAEKLPKIFELCKSENIDLKIYQQCLLNQKETLKEKYDLLNIESEIFDFSNNLLDYFSKTDVAITRSGSSMLAELLNCKIPIISVPLPSSADNHQFKNARYFKEKGYGFLVEENMIDQKLFPLIKSIHKDKDLINQMKSKQNTHSNKNVFTLINELIIKIINEKN